MDPITHVASGAVAALALPERWRVRGLLPFAMLTAASPDVDVWLGSTPVEYLTLHRAITHSFIGGALLALLLAVPAHLLLRRRAAKWTPLRTWAFAYALVLLHIWLDCITSYGTQVLQPFSDWRAAMPAVYIIDLVLTVPLALAGLWSGWTGRRTAAVCAFVWMFLYPGVNLGVRLGLETAWAARLAAEGTPAKVVVLPEAFAPFNWKIVAEGETTYRIAGLALRGESRPRWETYAKADPVRWRHLTEQDALFRVYGRFAMFLAEEKVQTPEGEAFAFRDLRFSSTVPMVRKLFNRGETPFRLFARLAPDNTLLLVRFIGGASVGGDTGWVPPVPPRGGG